MVWAAGYGDYAGHQRGRALAVDSSNNTVVLLGSFTGAIDFGNDVLTSADGKDIFLAKLPP